MIRVFIVEDHAIVRQGFDLLLEHEGIKVCGEAQSLVQARAGVGPAGPDLVMVDLSLGGEDGLELVRESARSSPDLPFLVVSMHGDGDHVARALRAGARGYVTKRETVDLLAPAIRECLLGRTYLSPKAEQALLEAQRR